MFGHFQNKITILLSEHHNRDTLGVPETSYIGSSRLEDCGGGGEEVVGGGGPGKGPQATIP